MLGKVLTALFKTRAVDEPAGFLAHARAARARGDLEGAIATLKRAVARYPGVAELQCELGICHRIRCDAGAARDCFVQAAKCDPHHAAARAYLGNIEHESGRHDAAVAWYREALAIEPENIRIRYNVALGLVRAGDPRTAVEELRRVLEASPDYLEAASSLLFNLNYLDGTDGEALARAHRELGKRFSWDGAPKRRPSRSNPRRRLRIGYVSGDFRSHSVAYFFEPLLQSHDREQFEIFCYSNNAANDAVTARLKNLADGWRDIIENSDDEMAARITGDSIDILVDLSGHSAGNRLAVFARRPAPVQMTYLGYPTITGLDAMDYRLTDTVVDPPGETREDTGERLLRLARPQWCYLPGREAAQVSSLPALARGHVSFASFNNTAKIGQRVLDAWGQLLARVPDARMLIRCTPGSVRAEQLLAAFARHGVAARRIDFIEQMPADSYMTRYHGADIALDSFPYNGVTTTCESLWMGLPVVTLAGDTPASRTGASLLSGLGAQDWIAASVPDYIEVAASLAADPARLARIRAGLRERMARSPLRDAAAFANEVETVLRAAWIRSCGAAQHGD